MLLSLIVPICIGIAAGYIANKVMKLNFGILFCLIIGIIGAVIGNFIFGTLSSRLVFGIDWPMFTYVGQFITSTVGSIVLLWLYTFFKRK